MVRLAEELQALIFCLAHLRQALFQLNFAAGLLVFCAFRKRIKSHVVPRIDVASFVTFALRNDGRLCLKSVHQ